MCGRNQAWTVLVTLLGVLQMTPAPAAAGEPWRYGISAGVDVSRGDYGLPAATSLLYVPVTVRLDRGPWSARMTLAHLSVEGPAGATTFGGQGTRQSGPGDVVLQATWSPERALPGGVWLDLSARVKVPTADEDKGLGTGSFDYTAQVEALRSFGPWTPFAALGYRILGDAPGVKLGNGFIASAGVDRRIGGSFNAGAVLDWREPGARSSDDVLEVVPYLSWRLGGGLAVTGYATLGLAGGSPDHGVGMQLSFRSER